MEDVKKDSKPDFVLSDDGVLRFRTRLCVPDDGDLRREFLEEAHCSRHDPPRRDKDVQRFETELLVVRNEARYCAICGSMFGVSTSES